jgi:hypothetical protein
MGSFARFAITFAILSFKSNPVQLWKAEMLSFLYIYTVLQSLEYSPITMWGLCGASVRTLIFGTLAHFFGQKWQMAADQLVRPFQFKSDQTTHRCK